MPIPVNESNIKGIIVKASAISFSEKAIESIDFAIDDFRKRLCQLAEQLAVNEGLSLILERHIIEANDKLVSLISKGNEQVSNDKPENSKLEELNSLLQNIRTSQKDEKSPRQKTLEHTASVC